MYDINYRLQAKRLLKKLYWIYEVSEYKEDYAFKVIEAVLMNKNGYFTLFNGMPKINKCYLTVHNGNQKMCVCHQNRIVEILKWLELPVYYKEDLPKKQRYVLVARRFNYKV